MRSQGHGKDHEDGQEDDGDEDGRSGQAFAQGEGQDRQALAQEGRRQENQDGKEVTRPWLDGPALGPDGLTRSGSDYDEKGRERPSGL
jgi:hypothetical protein